jgi:salicylate hydroxylase
VTKLRKIAVVGCGPGGMASALFLHRAGFDVVLFDQFDRPKPIGSGLLIQPSGQAVLEALGLLDAVTAKSAPVSRLLGVNVANGKRALDMEYRHLGENVSALGIHRSSLFDVLFGAVSRAGIRIETESIFSHFAPSSVGVRPVFADGKKGDNVDLLIDATGAHGPLASGTTHILPYAAYWTTVDLARGSGIALASLDQRYHRASKMAGIMPVGVNPATGNQGAAVFWSVRPERADAVAAAGIERWRQQFLDLWPEAAPFVEQVNSVDDLTLAVYRHRTGVPSSHPRVFHLGDAWHCTSPQLGQGANMALMDAAALTKAIKYAENLAGVANHYRHYRGDHVRLYQYLSYMFTPLYQSDSRLLPVVRDAIIHNCARLPLVRTMIATVVSGKLGSSYVG